MTVDADLLPFLAEQYNDANFVAMPKATWVALINEALRTLCVLKPRAHTVRKVLTFVDGTAQALAAPDTHLIQLIRNMGADGQTPGGAIAGPSRQEEMDATAPTWHTDASTGEIQTYIWNEEAPGDFYVYPQATANPVMKAEALVGTTPTALADENEDVPVLPLYYPALNQITLAFAYAKDSDRSPGAQRAALHWTVAMDLLGLKSAIKMPTPRVAENVG